MSDKLEIIPEDWNIPKWANYIAQDADGYWYPYSIKPITFVDGDCNVWCNLVGGRSGASIIRDSPPKDYTQELYKVIWTYE